MKKVIFSLSIRCYYANGNYTEHHQQMKLSDIPKWIEAYKFTHPDCTSVTVKLWFGDMERQQA